MRITIHYIFTSLAFFLLLPLPMVANKDHTNETTSEVQITNKCLSFQKGVFYYRTSGLFIIIVRDGSHQSSYRIYPKKFKRDTIEWLEPCLYKLVIVEDKDPLYGRTVGFVNYVRITDVGQNYYDLEDKSGENGPWKPGNRIYKAENLEHALELQRQDQ